MQSNEMPTFLELAKNRLKYARPADRTITIKVSINTAKMMVENEENQNNA